MAHTNFPARTHRDSVSTALLSLQNHFKTNKSSYYPKANFTEKDFQGSLREHCSKDMQATPKNANIVTQEQHHNL